MSLTFRAATFNMENLFNRAKVLNLADKEQTSAILADVAKLEKLLGKAVYTAPIKADILKIAKAQSDYIVIREDRGSLFTGTGATLRVTASGAGDWDGVVEFRRARVNDTARESTAAVVKALKADVLCTVETEDRTILKAFNSQMLGTKKFKFPILFDGDDPRGIDVGLLSGFEIVSLKTHLFDKDSKGIIFSRDCLEVTLKLPDGRPLYFLCNHLKSQGYGITAANNAKRLRQANRIAEILAGYDLTKDLVIVAGDMNDKPGSAPLAPLLGVANLFDVLALQFANPADRWTYRYKGKNDQIDFLLVSLPLKNGFVKAAIERRGFYGINAITGETPFPSVTKPTDAASDHCAITAEFTV